MFERLRQQPDYALLDYCLSFDSFAASAISRLAEVDVLPTASWFGQAPQRGFQVAQAVLGPEGDAASRLIDIRRMALGAGRGGTAYAQADPVPSTRMSPDVPVETTPESDQLQIQVQSPAPRTAPTPAPVPAPIPARPPVSSAPARRAEAPAPVRRAEVAPARPAPEPQSRVQPEPRREVARVEAGARPSFNCRYARSRSERLVCRDAELARMDRTLNRAFEEAVASGVSRRALRAEQDSWLAVRESAADDPRAVADIYALRIEELRDIARAEQDY